VPTTLNKLLLSPLRGWDSLHAASLCSGCPKAKRYGISSMKKSFAILFSVLLSVDVSACDSEFPHELKSLAGTPFVAKGCYPFELLVPSETEQEILSKAFLRFYLPGNSVDLYSSEDAIVEAELKFSPADERMSSTKLCLSYSAAPTAVVEVIYEFKENLSGPVSMCAPARHIIRLGEHVSGKKP